MGVITTVESDVSSSCPAPIVGVVGSDTPAAFRRGVDAPIDSAAVAYDWYEKLLARDSERTGAAVEVVVSWPNSDTEAKEEDEAVEVEVPLMVGGRGIDKDKAGVVDLMDALEMESLFVMGRGSNDEEEGAD